MQTLKLTAACVFVNTRAGHRQREGMGPVGHHDDAFYCSRGRWHLDRIASEELAPTYSGGEHVLNMPLHILMTFFMQCNEVKAQKVLATIAHITSFTHMQNFIRALLWYFKVMRMTSYYYWFITPLTKLMVLLKDSLAFGQNPFFLRTEHSQGIPNLAACFTVTIECILFFLKMGVTTEFSFAANLFVRGSTYFCSNLRLMHTKLFLQ